MKHPEAVPAHVGRPVAPPVKKWIVVLHHADGQRSTRSADGYADASKRAREWLATDALGKYTHAWIHMLD